MKKTYTIIFLALLFAFKGWSQNLLQPFMEDVEQQADFSQTNLEGWTSLDLDGLNTAGPFQSFPGKGGPLGFFVYTPSQTNPPNTLDAYIPHSGDKYFASVSSYSGPANDWLISDELQSHPGGVLSFYVKSSFDYSGPDEFKVGYSMSGSNTEDFILFNGGNTTSPTTNWTKYEYIIPPGAKHLAINCVSQAVMMLVDDIQFVHNVEPQAPNTITDLSVNTVLGNDIEVTFNWNNPVVDKAGNPLTDITGVKVYRGTNPMNLTEIADLSGAVGESMTYVDLLPEGGSYIHRFVAYNNLGNGVAHTTPLTFFGYETIPGAPKNITFTQNASLQTVISWDEVDYGVLGGTLENPVVGYTIIRKLGNLTETLAEMHANTTYTETEIPDFNLYTYEIIAQTSPDNLGIPAEVSAYSGMNENQVPVTDGNKASDQVFELSRSSIISQSIYTADQIGSTGLITSLSYFGNLGTTTSSRYKIYMSTTNRETFGTTLNNAVWEFFGDQKLLFDGYIEFPAGRNAITIDLDQPFYYDATSGENVIITIVKPLVENPPSVNPREFYNTPVEGMRTYYSIGYSTDLSLITNQPPAWSTEEVPTIPSIVTEKRTDYGSLAGTVTLLDDNSPIEGVTITITPEGASAYQTEITLTNELGVYTVPALMPGDYLATFSKDTYNTYETNFTIAANQELILDAALTNANPIVISGSVKDENGTAIEGATLTLTGYSDYITTTDALGNFALNAFGEKEYELEVFHPLYASENLTFTSEVADYNLDPFQLELALHKPVDIVAVNNNGVGDVDWSIPVGYFNEKTIGWGSFNTTGEKWGNGGDPFISGIRFETSDLETQIDEDAKLTHVKAYIANNAEIIVKVFEGENAEQLVYSQPATITEEGWYIFELSTSIPIDVSKELWIGIEFLAGQYGAYPIGLDDGPGVPGRKGGMKYENGVWTGLNLTNKNWTIYGIVNNTMDANPSGYKVYRSPATVNDWTELTPTPITETTFSDTSLIDQEPNMYKYGISALYETNLISEKGISNEIQHNMFFDFTLEINTDYGSAEDAYISIWNADNFVEGFIPIGSNSLTFSDLLTGDYTVRVELENYEIVELTNVTVEDNNTLVIPLTLLKVQPANLIATIEGASSARLDWTLHQSFTDKIERYQDFERENIGNYILKDLDGLETYTYTNFTWPNAGVPMSFMVFNPYSTIPAIDLEALSGRRYLTAFAGPNGANNDWLIIPAGQGEFSFNASSLLGSDPEKIKVLYSTSGSEPSDFTAFGGEITVPENWTEYSFNAPEETKYVAINYISNDTYFVMIDDVTYEKNYNHEISYNIYLDGELVSSSVTETTFTLENLTNGTHLAEVEAVYETGVSEKTEVLITLLDVESYKKDPFQIYPNPTSGIFAIVLAEKAEVSVIDMHGRVLSKSVKEAGTSLMNLDISSGTYIINVVSEFGTSSKKLIVH